MSSTVYVIGPTWPAIDHFMTQHHEGRWSRLVLEGVLVEKAVERLAPISRPVVVWLPGCDCVLGSDEVVRQLTSQGVTWMRQ